MFEYSKIRIFENSEVPKNSKVRIFENSGVPKNSKIRIFENSMAPQYSKVRIFENSKVRAYSKIRIFENFRSKIWIFGIVLRRNCYISSIFWLKNHSDWNSSPISQFNLIFPKDLLISLHTFESHQQHLKALKLQSYEVCDIGDDDLSGDFYVCTFLDSWETSSFNYIYFWLFKAFLQSYVSELQTII